MSSSITGPGYTLGTGAVGTSASVGYIGSSNITITGAGGGGGGVYYTTGYTGPTYTYDTNSDIVLKRPGKPDLKVGEALDLIMERLSIISPDIEKLEKYSALKKAYDHYKLIESLIQEDNKNGK
jgi:hypothetical protein